jgi:hypothetical protein
VACVHDLVTIEGLAAWKAMAVDNRESTVAQKAERSYWAGKVLKKGVVGFWAADSPCVGPYPVAAASVWDPSSAMVHPLASALGEHLHRGGTGGTEVGDGMLDWDCGQVTPSETLSGKPSLVRWAHKIRMNIRFVML